MIWILCIVIGVLVGLLAGGIFAYYIKNKTYIGTFTIVMILFTVVITRSYLLPTYYAWSFETLIRDENPLIDLIAEKSPEDFAEYMTKVKSVVLLPNYKSHITNFTIEFISRALAKYGKDASDKSLYNYLAADTELDKKLFTIDPILVLLNEFPSMFLDRVDSRQLYRKETNEYFIKTLQAAHEVILSGIENPQPMLTDDDIKKAAALFRDVITTLSNKYGEQIVFSALKQPNDPALDHKNVAEIIIAFNEEILAKKISEVGLMLRYAYYVGGIK